LSCPNLCLATLIMVVLFTWAVMVVTALFL
jgi:hypothetical protein